MNIKTLFWAGTLFLSAQAYSQIGIKTPTPSSTLDVRGSIEGNYLEITDDYPLLPTDYHVSFSGTGNSKLTLPSKSATDNSAVDFRGRKYYIRNNSTTADLTLTAAGGEILRLGGTSPGSNIFVLKAGKSATLTAGNANGWDLDVNTNWALVNLPYIIPTDSPGGSVLAGTSYTTVAGSQINVTVPSPNTKLILSFMGSLNIQGQSKPGAFGTLRFRIAQTTGTTTTTYNDVDMASWAMANTNPQACGLNYSMMYPISNLAPGTYTFSLQAIREAESAGASGLEIWFYITAPTAELYLK
ncbi:hypothetical protein JET18_07160 [Chryseobacterium sp. L7]|uniref:DUF4397 domain-containing protein n=1 Tax=Chryseobacterium endalhagicum TaxID=2797638 RepID=A0ABS1QDB7_9FLAO|nr:hypothetical protein [Chryseobacterium endalhagicum]MBL1220611.1 hypothetical protein [Chryseobacterium endalhagicum]